MLVDVIKVHCHQELVNAQITKDLSLQFGRKMACLNKLLLLWLHLSLYVYVIGTLCVLWLNTLNFLVPYI